MFAGGRVFAGVCVCGGVFAGVCSGGRVGGDVFGGDVFGGDVFGGDVFGGGGGVASLNHRLQGGIPPGCEGGRIIRGKGRPRGGY